MTKISAGVLSIIIILCFTSCYNKASLKGNSELFSKQRRSKIVILPFEPVKSHSQEECDPTGFTLTQQARDLTAFYLKKHSNIEIITSEEISLIFGRENLINSSLNDRLLKRIRYKFKTDMILSGKFILHLDDSTDKKTLIFKHDLTLKLIDTKSGYIISKYFLKDQPTKLEVTTEKLIKKMCEDMRWSNKMEIRDDIFDESEQPID